MAESIWHQLDRMVAEYLKVKTLLRAVRGGRFRGRKPNGKWWVRFGSGRMAVDLLADSPEELVRRAAVYRCGECGHKTQGHRLKAKDEVFCPGVTCTCEATQAQIIAKQSTTAWIAERAGMTERELFRGVRGPEVQTEDARA
ncbi:hypothetical protein COCOR_04047 [Corallococcus coralloides DSM 2259]|uniref:Uncharacterized protein n=1 Tax=Corallococcus coralloides (strain ATCC 25202 / DSM 2259 / NBRC 100086 / M2) TaxID=1144275 RepID=H8MVR6_CORCM|nr:hypothetical protein [Corallococcus coralloides]AFE05596.1 hypothetical protein COCOR_04047 [Corallococcus coralloides DSM 2259]